MSEQDRMDRAKRIRQLREGRRTSDDADESDRADDAAEPDPADDGDGPNQADGADAPAAGAAAEVSETDQPPADEDDDAMAHVDEAVSDAVDRVTGASASVPSPDEMGESVEDPIAPAGEGPETGEPEDIGDAAGVGAATPGIGADASSSDPETRVLEFTLGEERYCLDIEYIEEIVKSDDVTRVPNTPAFVEGVVDLRGQITTILNPKVVIGTEDRSRGDLLLVFDGEEFDEQGHLGWVVDDVRQVSPVSDADVNEPPVDDDHVEGVIDRGEDEDFVVWTSPDLALDEAT